jgi:hypothetical protein
MSTSRRPSTTARALGTVLAVSVTSLIVAYPLFFLALVAVIEWTGCFIECREPDPNRLGAAAAGLVALLLLGLPVLVGVLSWRGSSRKLLLAFAGLALLAAAMWLLGAAI